MTELGCQVIAVSGDNVKSHALFKKANSLPFTLLADEKGQIAKKFGVVTRPGGSFKKEIDGEEHEIKRGVTIMRWTFIIGKNGKIIYKNDKVNAAKASQEAIGFLEKK